jgi:hypothetical protein
MSQESEPPHARLDAPTPSEIEDLELFRRSPHPYLRHQNEIRGQSAERSLQQNGVAKEASNQAESRPKPSKRASSRPNRASSRSNGSNCASPRANASSRASSRPNDSNSTSSHPNPSDRTMSDVDGRKRRKASSQSQSPSGSGTEADDEGYSFVKALPPPPLRPHKGLRDTAGSEQGGSPLLTPTQIDNEGRRFSDEYFADKKRGKRKGEATFTDDEARAARQKYLKRRRMELVRRTTETALLAGIGFLAVSGCGCWEKLLGWHRGKDRNICNWTWLIKPSRARDTRQRHRRTPRTLPHSRLLLLMAKRQSVQSAITKTNTRPSCLRPGYHIIPNDTTHYNFRFTFCVLSKATVAKYPSFTRSSTTAVNTF